MTRRYSDEEARAVFERALSVEPAEGMSREDLIAAAAEVGITRDAVERAIADVEQTQAERDARRAVLRRRRRGLWKHFVTFVAVNLFIFALNALLTPGFWWSLVPLLAWGLGLFFHAWAALSREVSERALRAELRRPELRKKPGVQELFAREEQERRRARQQRLAESTKAFGEAVEDGVAAVLGRIAHDVRDRAGERQARAAGGRVRVDGSAGDADAERSEPASVHRTQR